MINIYVPVYQYIKIYYFPNKSQKYFSEHYNK